MAMLVSPTPGSRRARHVVAHLTDTCLVPPGDLVLGEVDTCELLLKAVDLISEAGYLPDALVITGDLAFDGSPEAYHLLRDLTGELREVRGVRLIVTPGNADDRRAIAQVLYPGQDPTTPRANVHDVAGLRIISLDTTIAGADCGRLSARQLDWLEEVLSVPAPYGTILAMHHPPIPAPTSSVDGNELLNPQDLARIIAAHPVRAILAGHFHFCAQGTLAGVPVNVAPPTSYTASPIEANGDARGMNSGQGLTMVHLYDDSVVFSHVPLRREPELFFYTRTMHQEFYAMGREEQDELIRYPAARQARAAARHTGTFPRAAQDATSRTPGSAESK